MMSPYKVYIRHLILVLVVLVAQTQSSWGISLTKRISQTNKLNNFQAEDIKKTFENVPNSNLLEGNQLKAAIVETRNTPFKKIPRKDPPKKVPKRAQTKLKQPRKKSRKDNPLVRAGSCNGHDEHVLDYGEATVIFSDDGNAAQRCRSSFMSPEGTTLRLDCPLFDLAGGCKKERLLVNEKGKKKINFCNTETPNSYESANNNLALIYARHERKKGDTKSPGFICRVMVIGERPIPTTTTPPPTTTTTTTTTRKYTWPSSSSTNPTTTTTIPPTTTPSTRPTYFSTWWPPGTYWTDQTWSDGTNEGWWSYNVFNTERSTTTPSPNNGTTWIAVTVTT